MATKTKCHKEKEMKPTHIPVTFSGDESVALSNCYIFRDSLAHKAHVSISTGISFTEDPNLLVLDIVVPGSRKNTLKIGIPLTEAVKMSRQTILWNECTSDYDNLRLDVVKKIFQEHIPDLTLAPWTKEDIETLELMEAKDELQEMVKQDLLKIAAVSMEGKEDE
jgi:hypothetical protein